MKKSAGAHLPNSTPTTRNMLQKVNAWWWWQAAHKPWLLLLLSALVLGAAYPPSPLAPLIWLGFLPLLSVLEVQVVPRKGIRSYLRAFAYIYPTLFVWNLIVAYWLMLTAVYVPAGQGFVSFMGGFMASAANPVVMAIPLLLWVFARKRLAFGWALAVLAVYWLAYEYLHLQWDLSWSWLNLGHALSPWPFYIQYIEFTGVLGITLHILGVMLALFYMGWRHRNGLQVHARTVWLLLAWVLLPLCLWPLLARESREVFATTGTIQVRIVQPNINPYDKFSRDAYQMVADMVQQAEQGLPQGTRLIVFPETAIPTHLEIPNPQERTLGKPFHLLGQRHKAGVLIGYHPMHIIRPGDGTTPDVAASNMGDGYFVETFNGASIFGAQPVEVYKKAKLVPFIERAPFMQTLAFLRNWQIDIGCGFSRYSMPDSLQNLHLLDGTPIAPLICYESEFHAYVATLVGKGAQMIAVITNDGWWGQTSGYIQHLHLARLRAIETRRDIARSANTGISAFIDAQGNIRQSAGWDTRAVLDDTVQLRTTQTFFVRNGDILGKTATLLAFALILFFFFRKKWTISG